MTNKLQVSLVSLVLAVTMCQVLSSFEIKPDIAVPSTSHGIRYSPATPRPKSPNCSSKSCRNDSQQSKVLLEMFIEVYCTDSQHGWGIMKQVQAHYGTDKLDVVIQQMPLPYHRNAFLGTQGLYLIHNSSVSDKVFDYLEESFNMAWNYSTAATREMTEVQVLDMMGDMANRVTGLAKAEFTGNINNNNYIATTRGAWKYGAKRGVAVTPTFFVMEWSLELEQVCQPLTTG